MASCCCSSSSTAGLQVLIQAAVEQLEIFNGTEEVSAVPIPMDTVSAATLAADTAYHVALTDSNPKKFIQILNRTDGDIYVSLDGSDNHFHVTSGSSQTLQFASNKATWSGNVYVKQDTANPPVTTGNVEVSAYY